MYCTVVMQNEDAFNHGWYQFGLKINPVFRATRPYLSEPADPRGLDFFFYKKYRFFVRVFIIEVSILKKNSRPYLTFFKTVVLNTRFIFLALVSYF